MKYTLTTYRDGKKLGEITNATTQYSIASMLSGAAMFLEANHCDEYEITNEKGDVVAYAYTEDSPKALQANSERAQSRKEAKSDRMADIAREIQSEELASREAQRGCR